MSFWSDLGSVFSSIGDGISGVTGFLGNQVANVTGIKHIGEGFGQDFGENFGKNIPTTFTLNHNVNVDGKIDVAINVSGAIAVNVNVNLKDAIAAARIVRDGLVRFDMSGGLFRVLTGDNAVYQKTLPMLRELRTVVTNGVYGDPTDRYLLEYSFVNSSTADQGNTAADTGFMVTANCSCALSVGLNGHNVLEDHELTIRKTDSPVDQIPRIDKEISVTRLASGDNSNVLSFAVKPLTGAPPELMVPCQLQLRLLRKTKNWKYTVGEWFFDGKSGTSSGAIQFLVRHDANTPKPDPSKKATALAAEIDDVISQISLPLFKPPAGEASPGIGELVSSVLLASYSHRSGAIQTVLNSLNSLDGDDPNGFDVRTPIYAAISCMSGSMLLTVMSSSKEGPAENSIHVIDPEFELRDGDEIAVLLPFAAGKTVPTAGTILDQLVQFQFTGGAGSGRCSVSLYYGLEWATRIIESKTITLSIGQTESYAIDVSLADRLADAPHRPV